MRFASAILYVPDVAAATRFYGEAFGLEVGFASPDGSYAMLAGDGGQLAFAAYEVVEGSIGDEARRAPAGFEVWIEAEDVPAAVEQAVAAGAQLVVAPATKPWGQEVAYVRDPNGTLVEIGQPIG